MSLFQVSAFVETAEPDAVSHPAFTFIDLPWVADALCAQVDVGDIWYPDKGGSTREAKQICAHCFVQAECLDYALTTGERFGIWGGFSERERRKLTDTTATALKHPPRFIKHGTEGGYRTHYRRGEPPCEPCRTAGNRQQQDRTSNTKAGRT